MNVESLDSTLARTYHIEKYLAPGAFAITLLLLLPLYVFMDPVLSLYDFGCVLIAVLVVGHLLESLKAYLWGGRVSKNGYKFYFEVDDILKSWGFEEKDRHRNRTTAITLVFSLLKEADRSEYTWNLVRWQKMLVESRMCILAGIEWLGIAFLCYLQSLGVQILNVDLKLPFLSEALSPYWSVALELIVASSIALVGWYINSNGVRRQDRTNALYLQFFRQKKDKIVEALSHIT